MVITNVNQVVYRGDGVTTAFPFTFRIIDATDIKLLLIDADGTETDIQSDYFVDTVNNTVHYPGYAPGAEPPEADQPAPVQTGQKLVIYRELPITQEKNLGDKWPFFVIELGLDKLTLILQQIYGWWGRTLKFGVGWQIDHPDFDTTIPVEAGKTWRVNDEGTGFVATGDPDEAVVVANNAVVVANNAKDIAAGAKATAEGIAATAQEAKDIAQDAKTVADDAKDVAAGAKTTAEGIADTAQDAKDIAQDAKAVAATALPLSGGTVTGDLTVEGTITAPNFTGLASKATADAAGNNIQTTYARLGDMLGYGVVKGCTPSLINNTVHIDSGIVVAKTGNKHKVSAKDFNIATADTIPRYDVIAVDIDGNISYIKGTAAYVQNPQAGEATYKMSSQPIVGNWMRFGSIYGADLKPTADSNVAGNNGYFLVGSTIADTVKNLVNVFNSIPALSDKWTAYTVEGASDQFMVREKVAGGNTPRNFMKETKEPVPIIQLSMTRSVQKVISSPTIPNTSIPLCTIRIEKNNTPVLSDSRSITPNISPNIANVKAYGAVGDGVFDDSFAIQKAFDTGKSVYFPAGTYRIDTMITRQKNNNVVIDASNAHILYTGKEYAFKLGSNNNSVFKFNTITALNGGGIWLYGDNTWGASAYTDIWFKVISVETNGVYVTSKDWVWMNETYLHYGTFTRGDNGFYYFHNSKNGTSRWIFDHVSVEGVQRGFNFKQGDYAKQNNKWFAGFEFNNGRYEENDNLITVDGKATDFLIVSNSPVNDKYLEYTKECTGWVFISGGGPLGKLTNGRYFKGGTYIITSKDTDLTDLNNLTITGKYSVISYGIANLMKNSPITDMPFYVIMQEATSNDLDYNSNNLSQIIYDWENRRKYTRMYTKSSATWTEWKSARDMAWDVSSQIKPLISDITLSGVNGKYRNGVITIQCTVNVTKRVPSGTKIINIPTSKNMILGWMLDNKNKTSIPWISSENKDIQAQTDLEMGNTYTIYITYVATGSY